eukprot:TRINITY_DN6651_c0_g1_i2.p1 TRINITY_DN6651_c0_g1~~TRINITY_DN6651_c0_g1_i2.p1  ORF type:complete len:124 (+),score=36.39 TRINITY_DN6651_c0_g1_i2:179-550(+)
MGSRRTHFFCPQSQSGIHHRRDPTNKYKLEELFWAVSDPKSPQYGQYLSLDELTTLIAPEQQSLDQIESWLADHDVVGCKKATTRDFLHCEARAEKVEEMLNTKFFEFVHSQNKDNKIARTLR